MKKEKPLRFVVMGAGNIGRRHIRIILALPGAQLVAVLEPAAEARKCLAEIWQGPCLASFEEFAASGLTADVLSVCTPNHLHSQQATRGLCARLHVICEKPLALWPEEGKAILETAARAGKQVFCMQQLVFGPVMQLVKNLLLEQKTGPVRQVQVHARWNRDESYYVAGSWRGKLRTDGGPLFTQFSHFIHALYWLFGDLVITAARFENHRQPLMTEFEDSGQVTFDFKSGATGQFHYTTAAARSQVQSEMVVKAEKGSFRISGQYLQELSCWDLTGVEVPLLPALSPLALQEAFYRQVITRIGAGEPGDVSAREGLKVVELIREIYHFRPPAFNPAPLASGSER